MKKVVLAALLASLSLSASAAQTLRFATEASYPPFEFVDSDNKIQGFDVDLANALCKEIDATCTFTNQAFDSLIQPYYDNSATFIAQKGKLADVAALKGKRVGVQNGTTHQKYLSDKHSDITIVPYDSYQNAVLDLKNGRIDAVFGDTAVVNEWLKQNANLAALGEKVTDKAYFGTGLGIAVRQGNSELQQKFNGALDKIKADGTYKTIYNKWFQQ